MKTLIFVLLAGLLLSCAEEPVQPVKETITFNVVRPDKARFNAVIHWMANGVEYRDPVNAFGYASSFEVFPGDPFTVNVTSDTPEFQVIFFRKSRPFKAVTITSGEPHTFNSWPVVF